MGVVSTQSTWAIQFESNLKREIINYQNYYTMKITLAFLLLGLTAIFAQQPDADASSVEAFIDADEDVQQGHRMLPNYKPPKQPKCDSSPYCKGNNCCGGNCYEVCEEIRGGGGKKGGFYYGGYYDDGPDDDWGPDGYYGNYFG